MTETRATTELILGVQKRDESICAKLVHRVWRLRSMVKQIIIFIFVGLLPLVTPVHSAQAIQVTDDRGVMVKFEQSPHRIVSLLPSLTESICELGQCQRLVGVDRYSNWPVAVTKLPQLGGGLDPNIEAVVALKPDVVLMATSSRASERLEALGIKVVALEPKSHADVQRVLIKVGQVLDIPEDKGATRLWHAINTAMTAAAQTLPAKTKGVRVYYEVNQAPYAAGESSFIGETLTRLGAINIIPAALGPFPKINPEFVVRSNPDVIMIGLRNSAGLAQRPGWAGMRALREKRLCEFSLEDSDVLLRAGPRMAEAARIMAKCLRMKAP